MALSGGVDSSVCVHMLKEQGYEVCAVVMSMSPAHTTTVQAAKETAEFLDIPLKVVDMNDRFKNDVIDYFITSYTQGKTPNPCIMCNPTVKFKGLIEVADELGCEKIATGHYARLVEQDGYTHLYRGSSLKRDQSYMLYRLTQEYLSRLIFPLSEIEKPKVREIAEQLGLSCANKPDSQENCFIPSNDYAQYIIDSGFVPKVGDFISPDGEVCGKHKGIIHYTVGQRKGLGIALGEPVFIKEIDSVTDKIYLARKQDSLQNTVTINDIVTPTGRALESKFDCMVKVRSTSMPSEATVEYDGQNAVITLEHSELGVAKGQSVVMYDGDRVIGGGFII